MVVDTSAVIAIAAREPVAKELAGKMTGASRLLISAASYLEAGMVLTRIEIEPVAWMQEFTGRFGIAVVPVDRAQAGIALGAFSHFGKGRHPARLNFGDCFAYALAKSIGEALLFVGGDFALTDIDVA